VSRPLTDSPPAHGPRPPLRHAADRCASESPEPVLGVSVDRAATMLPADLLHGDETIILLLKPSPWYILLSCLETVVIIALICVLALWTQSLSGVTWYEPRAMIGFCALLAAVRIGWQAMEWLSRLYVLTDRRVIRVMGVFRVLVYQAPLRQIQHTQAIFTIRERLFGLGTISFSTSGSAFVEAYWTMVRRPVAVHRRILQVISRYGR